MQLVKNCTWIVLDSRNKVKLFLTQTENDSEEQVLRHVLGVLLGKVSGKPKEGSGGVQLH